MSGCYVKGYTRFDGTKVKGHYRSEPCSTKAKLIPKLKKGVLSKYGYEDVRHKKAGERHNALKKAILGCSKNEGISKRDAALSIFRKLNAIATLKKNTLPNDSLLHKRDARWIKREYF